MENNICNNGSYTGMDIPETEFLMLISDSLSDLLGKNTGLLEGPGALLIGIYPLLRNGEEWGSINLFRHCTGDPVLSRVIKSRTNLIRYLDNLTELGFLKKQGEKKVTYLLGDATLKELRVLDQIFYNTKFRSILQENYIFIHIITCVIARLIRTLFPEDPEELVFDLASVLIQAGAKFAGKDLGPRRVLEHQCPKCIYPFHPENETNEPLDSAIKKFIAIRDEGVLQAEIIDFFEMLAYSEAETTQMLQELINQGEVRINAGRYILNT